RVAPIIGGYDGFGGVHLADAWPHPDVVIRLGASPTSKSLRKYLAAVDADQFLIDPAGEWREAEFTVTDLVVADPSKLTARLSRHADTGAAAWRERWTTAEARHTEMLETVRLPRRCPAHRCRRHLARPLDTVRVELDASPRSGPVRGADDHITHCAG
ncbi:MAG: hypothetical protein J07HR59_01279, partial [Halorubrum sp. J07HR59]